MSKYRVLFFTNLVVIKLTIALLLYTSAVNIFLGVVTKSLSFPYKNNFFFLANLLI